MLRQIHTILVFLTIGLTAQTCLAQSPAELIKERYTKHEYLVPMRDGVKLFTVVWVPKDDSQAYPLMLQRTPYGVGPYGVDRYSAGIGPSSHFENSGYIFVHQDVRGRLKSEGKFIHVRPLLEKRQSTTEADESTDTFDTIDWLLKNIKGHNGKAGLWGISYPGFYVNCGMIDAHPALKAVSPQAPVTDLFDGDDVRHNGALQLVHNFGFMNFFHKMRPEMYRQRKIFDFDHGTPDGYEFFLNLGPLKNADSKYLKGNEPFWNEILAHETYDDYCKARDVRRHMRNIKPAVMTVGGWFDAEDLAGSLGTFRQIEAIGAPATGNHLVVGPWQHGGWASGAGDKHGDIAFQLKTSETYREQMEFPFFEFHLKGKGTINHPKAWAFETGTNRWRRFTTWPPEGIVHSFEFDGGGKLGIKNGVAGDGGFDEFTSDPAKPVPFINKMTTNMSAEYMTADQRFVANRPDVLVYQTPKLEDDVTFAGPIEVELFVSTTGTDADWAIKVIDVYPGDFPDPDPNPMKVRMGSYQQLVRGDLFRGKFRNSREKPEPFKPGEIAKVSFKLNDVLHTFRPGHRIMIHVQSSWFPLFDRNPQSFCDISKANQSDFQKATHRVYRDAAHPSKIAVRIVK